MMVYISPLKLCNFADETKFTNQIAMEKIDQLDRKILKIITQNAKIPFKDVAKACGVSRASIHQRVQHMIDIDVITGSGYTVNPKMLGFQMCVYIGITLERGSMYKEVVSELEKIPEIVESQYTLGSYTILIKLYAKNDEHLMELLNGKIQEIPGVATTETLSSLDQRIKRTLPIE
jgi:Lrp/AsnC family transcriptional regulator for asnA, asnC and gidA